MGAMDQFMQAAVDEALLGRAEGGIPIGAVLVHGGEIIGRGHNRRVQMGSAIRHGETDALENAGRLPASVYRNSVMYTTLSPCAMCTGAILLYGIGEVVVGENRTFMGEEALLAERGVSVTVLDDETCVAMMSDFIETCVAMMSDRGRARPLRPSPTSGTRTSARTRRLLPNWQRFARYARILLPVPGWRHVLPGRA